MRRLWMIVIVVVVCGSLFVFHGLVGAGDDRTEHLVPAEKDLDKGAMPEAWAGSVRGAGFGSGRVTTAAALSQEGATRDREGEP